MISKLTYAALINSAIAEQLPKKCPFGFTSNKKSETASMAGQTLYPSEILTCSQDKALQTKELSLDEYEEIASQIIMAQHDPENQTEDFHKGVYAACLLRLEGHDLMDYRKSKQSGPSGGSDGCVNFKDPDNAGLGPCLERTGIQEIYGQWCDKISLADFMVLAAEVATGSLSIDFNPDDMFQEGTLLSRFRDQFRYGRKTVEECPDNLGLMPNPENSCHDLEKIFIEHVYRENLGHFKAWGLMAALSGAHTLGFAKLRNSGYDGFWGDEKNQAIFNNDYYKNVIAHGWGPQRAVNGNEGKNQWILIDSSSEEQKNKQMMLNTDMCLFYTDNRVHAKCMTERHDGILRNRKHCKQYQGQGEILTAKDSECCAWFQFSLLHKYAIDKNEPFCGLTSEEVIELKKQGELKAEQNGVEFNLEDTFREPCCKDENRDKSFGDCDSFDFPHGPAYHAMILFAKSNERFYQYFLAAWRVATENGWNNLKYLDTTQVSNYENVDSTIYMI